jgi:hypothetical protein
MSATVAALPVANPAPSAMIRQATMVGRMAIDTMMLCQNRETSSEIRVTSGK